MTINLPQITIDSAKYSSKAELLVIGGGRTPAADWLKKAAAGRKIWCIDHGIDICHQLSLPPAMLIGDADSAAPEAWQWAENTINAKVEKHPVKKDLTDTQLTLEKLASQKETIIFTGAFGHRFDHTFSTIFSVAYSQNVSCLADDKELLVILKDNEAASFTFKNKPKAISLLPLTASCKGVTMQNVYWPLDSATLTQEQTYAVSNELTDINNKVTLSLKKGILGFYCCFSE